MRLSSLFKSRQDCDLVVYMVNKITNYGIMPNGTNIEKYIISNDNNMKAEILTLGATLDRLFVTNKLGESHDILLGFDNAEGYLGSDYQGAIVGPYANRICEGKFSIDANEYNLICNEDGKTSLHSAREYTDSVWKADIIDDYSVKLSHFTPDGRGGFPANVNISVTYTLSNENALRLDFSATTDKATIINPCNHAYFNLSGYDSGAILDTFLQINASNYTPVDENKIPFGRIESVKDTPFTFLKPTKIGERINLDCEQLKNTNGYDHNFCIDGADGSLKTAATAYDEKSGIVMDVLTSLPGIQFYAGNFLNGAIGKGGKAMTFRSGFCLETQYYPDTPNHPSFPQCTLRPGEKYKSSTIYKFTVK